MSKKTKPQIILRRKGILGHTEQDLALDIRLTKHTTLSDLTYAIREGLCEVITVGDLETQDADPEVSGGAAGGDPDKGGAAG